MIGRRTIAMLLALSLAGCLEPPVSDRTGAPFDLDAFLTLRRRAVPAPTESEVRSAIESQLKPASVYRVRWIPAAADDAELPFD